MSEDYNYGFTVKRERTWNRDTNEPDVVDGRWLVYLPHQCDDWDIAGEYGGAVSHESAIASLEAFITQAQEALVALREEREHGAS